jgi:hypothetical protein
MNLISRNCISLFCILLFGIQALSAQQAGSGPVKIFILAGQSNMLGQGIISGVTTPGTLEYTVANDPDGKYQSLVDGGGNWVVRDDVWIRDQSPKHGGLTVGYGANSSLVGPEIGFGHAVGDFYESQVLIVKAAWGGKALATNFRPPSSGWSVNPPVNSTQEGFYYTEILRLVNEATNQLGTYFPDYNGEGFEIAGLCWHQGYNDKIDSARSAEYEVNLANLIGDLRVDLEAPNMPFVIATSTMEESQSYSVVELAQLKMEDAAAYPQFAGNVSVIDARINYGDLQFWFPATESPMDQGFHWNRNAKTYTNLGFAMAREMAEMVPERCPDLLRAEKDASGVQLSWRNGTETPASVRILRDGVEIAAAAPIAPSSFIDTGAAPGVIEYELQFTMTGDPCDPLTVTYDAGITDFEAIRTPSGIRLNWMNGLAYSGIQLMRNGSVIEPSLSGTSTTYFDAAPPTVGLITYSVVPTNGSAAPTEAQISIEGLGNALIYEPFGDSDFNLGENTPGIGLIGDWQSSSVSVDIPNLFFGSLPTSANSAFPSLGKTSANARVLIGSELFAAGLLDAGAVLWFSFVTSNAVGTNNELQFALGTAGVTPAGDIPDIADAGQAIGVNFAGGQTPKAATWSSALSAGASTGSIAQGSTGLIVGKITWGADSSSPDQVEIFLPASDMLQPATPVSTTSAVLDQSLFDTLSFAGKAPLIDEIRFGASYDDAIGADIPWAPDTTPPTPNPVTWASPPAAVANSAIRMTATTAIDENGAEYYFQETSGNPGGSESGWQRSPTFTDGGLDPDATYTYRVKVRDLSPALNETAFSAATAATTDTLSGPRQAFIYEPFADADSNFNGNSSGLGLTGNWSAGGYSVIAGENLSYGNLLTSGNRIAKTSGNYTKAEVDAGDTFNALGLLENSAEMWFSVLVKSDSGEGTRRTFVSIGDGPPDGFGRVGTTGVGIRVDGGEVSALTWSPNDVGSRVPVSDGTVLVVARLVWGISGADDTIDVFLPGTDLALPAAPVSSISADLSQKLFTVLGFAGGNQGPNPELDEIRFGLSYAEVVPAPSDYDSWQSSYSGVDLSDPNGDHDGDGQTNDEERIFGTDPIIGASSDPISVPLDAVAGTFSYTRRDPSLTGMSYQLWYSTDLEAWLEDVTAVQIAGISDGNGVQSVAVTVSNSLLNELKLFLRVKAAGDF